MCENIRSAEEILTQKFMRKTPTITFQAEDAAVLDILERAKKLGRGGVSKLINEAIRLKGDEALLKVLAREVKAANDKLRDAQESIRRAKVS